SKTFHNPSAGGPSPTVLNSFPRSAPNRDCPLSCLRRLGGHRPPKPPTDARRALPLTTPRHLPRTTTHGSQTARRCAKRSSATTAISPLTGQGVAPL
ncbi:MAG: hypothetical protein LBD24_04655, partial [Spirochaetaceae bacterium]|nr:hypothetical protein [Spirochaetaceae bacterium]